MKSHPQAVQSFARKLGALLMLRGAVRWTTVWFFIWGVAVLATRIAGVRRVDWLAAGLLGAIPLAVWAALREHYRRAAPGQVRAAYDGLNQCGGMIMAEEVAEMSAWQKELPAPSNPVLRWHSGRALGVLTLSAVFALVALCLPERLTSFKTSHPLEIGKLIGDLHTEVQTLKQEKILEPEKADELQKQLTRLQEQSSAVDPNKTWEALDHIKESNSDLARQAAQEAVAKTTSLTEAQTLASALQEAAESGLGQDTATRAAQDLAGMLRAAKLDDGLLKGQIPEELLSKLGDLSQADLQKLLGAMQFNKNNLGATMTNLARLRLIDPRLLAQCKNAGMCPNPNALADYLSHCTNCSSSFCELARAYCQNIKPGGGTAPMTWKQESSADGAKFKEEMLPPSSRLSDAQFVGVSRAAPELTGDDVSAGHGALAGATAGGGAANAQAVLPRHKQAVQRFFKREP